MRSYPMTSGWRRKVNYGAGRLPFCCCQRRTGMFIKPHVGKIAEALDHAEPGEVERVDCGKFIPRRFRPKALKP